MAFTNTTGPLGPGNWATAPSGTNWSNGGNILANDGVYATDTVGPGAGGGSSRLIGNTFGFNIPSYAIIDGIKLDVKCFSIDGAVDNAIFLQSGAKTSTSKNGNSWPASAAFLSYGGSSDTWGVSWLPSEINSANFAASVSAFIASGTATANVDYMQITVYWHAAPTDVPKRYIYQTYSSTGVYVGTLPNVISDFGFSQEINTAGTQITIECALTMDVSNIAVDTLTDESNAILTDENSTQITNDGSSPMSALGASGTMALIKNGNLVQVFEVSYWNPNGKIVFSGQMQRWEADYGGDHGEDKIRILAYSDGSDLDNYVMRGNPYTYTQDQANTSQNSNQTLAHAVITGGGAIPGSETWTYAGQTFQTGTGVTNLGAITLKLNGTARVTVTAYSAVNGTVLGSTSQNVSVGAATDIQFAFANPITTVGVTSYFFAVSVDAGQSIIISYQNTSTYANGQMYLNTNSGSGGSWVAQTTQDLYFKTFSGTGSTSGTFTSQDPSTGMLETFLNDYISRGGKVNYSGSTIQATGLSLSYGYNTMSILEGIKAMLTISPNGFYWYVDVGTDTLYFKQTSTTADIIFTKGKHLNAITMVATIENIKNDVYFSGATVSGSNIYVESHDGTSVSLYGPRLDRPSDNHVPDLTTARQVASASVATQKDEQYQTVIIVQDKTVDTTLLKPGMVVGYNGFGNYIDNLLMQIVRIDYAPEEVTLTLGVLPKRLHPAFDKLTRGLVALNTIANPTTPS